MYIYIYVCYCINYNINNELIKKKALMLRWSGQVTPLLMAQHMYSYVYPYGIYYQLSLRWRGPLAGGKNN